MTYILCCSVLFIIIHARAKSAILTVFWLEAEQMDIFLWYEYLPTIGRV